MKEGQTGCGGDKIGCLSQIFSLISDMIIVPTADIIVASDPHPRPPFFLLHPTVGQVEPGAGGRRETETGAGAGAGYGLLIVLTD